MSPRTVLIAGASSGIGLATAIALSDRKDRLVLLARDHETLKRAEELCRAAGADEVSTVAADVNDAEAVRRAVTTATDTYGRLDIVVHTATVMGYGSIEDMPAEVFEQVVDTAIHGTANLAREVLAVFRRQHRGTFIIINSLLGSITVPSMGAYSTAKWGQRAIARTLQQELRDEPDINVCIVSPGSTNTPIYDQAANYVGRDARPPFPVLQPERTAASIVGLTDSPRNHVSVPVGRTNPIIITGFRLLPWVYDRIVGPLFKLAALTGGERGPDTGNVFHPEPEKEAIHGRWPVR